MPRTLSRIVHTIIPPATALVKQGTVTPASPSQKNVGTTSFQVALEEAEVMTQAHGMEVVGWLAIDAGEGDWDGHDSPTPLRSGTPCGRKRAKRPMRCF
jgi:hypothetical protein